MTAEYTRGRALTELRALAAKTKGLRFEELPQPLRRAVHRHWGSMAAARKAAGIPARRPGKTPTWTEERVVASIKALARAGQHMSVSAVRAAGAVALVSAATHLFGNFTRARDAAGVQIVKRRGEAQHAWDAEAVVATIKRRLRDKEPLAVSKIPADLRSGALRVFGSWREAIEAAGLDYADITLEPRYADDELLDWLRQLALTHPSMTLYDLDRFGGHTVACRRRWGSLEQAAAAAGLDGWPVRVRQAALSKREIAEALRRLSRAGTRVNLSNVRQDPANQRLVNSIFKRFPSWDDAVAAAGLPPQRAHLAWTQEKVIDELRALHRVQPLSRQTAISKHHGPLYHASRSLFGSLAGALRAAGIERQ